MPTMDPPSYDPRGDDPGTREHTENSRRALIDWCEEFSRQLQRTRGDAMLLPLADMEQVYECAREILTQATVQLRALS